MLRTYSLSLLIGFAVLLAQSASSAPLLNYSVLQTLPHDAGTFTQGLVYENGLIYESSGLYGASYLDIYQASSGKRLKKHLLPKEIFAEGLSKVGNELYLLTWRKGILFRLDAESLKVKRTMRYSGQGWGLSKMNQQLVMSDGSSVLSLRDIKTFNELKKISVLEGKRPIDRLNELEFDGQYLWANRWQSNLIYRIDPESGKVSAKVDLSALVPREQKKTLPDVLNGIAFVPEKKAFWVSGKKWSKRYLIQIELSKGKKIESNK